MHSIIGNTQPCKGDSSLAQGDSPESAERINQSPGETAEQNSRFLGITNPRVVGQPPSANCCPLSSRLVHLFHLDHAHPLPIPLFLINQLPSQHLGNGRGRKVAMVSEVLFFPVLPLRP